VASDLLKVERWLSVRGFAMLRSPVLRCCLRVPGPSSFGMACSPRCFAAVRESFAALEVADAPPSVVTRVVSRLPREKPARRWGAVGLAMTTAEARRTALTLSWGLDHAG